MEPQELLAASRPKWIDRRWRLNNLYKITSRDGQEITFVMNEAQGGLYDGMHYQNIVLKARQRGFTTFIQILMLDACLFDPNTNAGVIAHNREDAEDFFSKKIKYAYDRLPQELKDAVPATQDSARQLSFANGSSIRVGTSLRSGTYQYLHVSEFGKLCARYPDKALEVVTGTLNTVHSGNFVFIESTAEGREGYFHKFCQAARALSDSGRPLTPMDLKFHFFPWWGEKGYREAPDHVLITADVAKYFEGLEAEHGIALDAAQKAWYAKKLLTQGDKMKREFPSTPDEAFEASIEGAYYGKLIQRARQQGRICNVPFEPSLPVNTFWDLGMDDSMTIWLHQRLGMENRFIGYYENSGEGIPHYAAWLKNWAAAEDAAFGEHYMPHDVVVKEMGAGLTRKEAAESLGIRPIVVVPRTSSVSEDIDVVRRVLPSCWFDEAGTEKGLGHLENYRKAWDDKLGVFKNSPLHNAASHAADGFRTFAMGYVPPGEEYDDYDEQLTDEGRNDVTGY